MPGLYVKVEGQQNRLIYQIELLNIPQPIASAAHTPAIQGTAC